MSYNLDKQPKTSSPKGKRYWLYTFSLTDEIEK